MKFIKNPIVALAVLFVLVGFGLIEPIVAQAAGPGLIDLGSIKTDNFVILGETWITDVPTSAITGNIGVSPAIGAQIGVTCAEMTGTSKIYEVDAGYAKANMSCVESGSGAKITVDNAVGAMAAAYTAAYGTTTPSVTTGIGATIGLGTPSFAPGIYKWTTGLTITDDITLDGGASDVWVFQIAGDLVVDSKGTIPLGVHIKLINGALASNVFWAVAGSSYGVTLGTYSTFNGTILSKLQIIMQTGAVLNGRALAQIQVTLDHNFINTASSQLTVTKVVTNDNGGIKVIANFPLFIDSISTPSGVATTTTFGLHTVSETSDSGYAATIGGDCAPDGTITLSAGDNKTCTITNNDIPGQFKSTINVVKVVINDSGGTKTIADFPLFANGIPVVSGTTNIFPANLTYMVTETADANYTRTFSGDCDSSGQINLITGDNRVCIITNDDIPLSISATSTPPIPPLIDVVKVASPLALPAGPGSVTYTYTLRNIGTVPMTNVTMVGDTCSPITLASGDTNTDAKLDVSETWVYHCSTTLSETHTNTVVATGWANGISTVDIASATVVVGAPVVPPLIHLVKKPSVFTLAAPGGAVTYTYTVTNPGTEPLSNVSITDDKCTGLPGRVSGHPGDINKNDLLESNETWSFTCQSNLTQTTTNTGTASGEANGLIARDFAIATVVVAATAPALPKTVVTAAPALPNAGLAPLEKNLLWNIIIPAGVLLSVLFSLVVVIKKRVI